MQNKLLKLDGRMIAARFFYSAIELIKMEIMMISMQIR